MKINTICLNNRAKTFCVETRKGTFEYPFARLDIRPTTKNGIREIFINSDLGREAVTYFLELGKENSVHLDAFLEYNKDPDYLRMLFLYELTVEGQKVMKISKLPKSEVFAKVQLVTCVAASFLSRSISYQIKSARTF